MVGSRTVVLDDPRLNSRWKAAPLKPVRVVLDPRLEVPRTARLVIGAAADRDREG